MFHDYLDVLIKIFPFWFGGTPSNVPSSELMYHFWQGLGKPYRKPRIEPKLAMCKANVLFTVLHPFLKHLIYLSCPYLIYF